MKTRSAILILVTLLGPICVEVHGTSVTGALAASVDDTVILVEPNTGTLVGFETGPVGWLFPAPGGILFAPDVVNGATAVIDTRSATVVERIDGLTMPYFGTHPDRYIAITGDVMVLSHPDRALMTRIETEIANPWQVIIAPDDAAMIVLERLPDAAGGVHVTTLNLLSREVVYRRQLRGDIRHMALSPQLGILALADASSGRVHLVDPGTFTPMASRPVGEMPVDVVFAGDGRMMVTAVDTGDGSGRLDFARFKLGKKGHRLVKEHTMALTDAPIRLAVSPGGGHVAVAHDGAEIAIVDVGRRAVIASHTVTGTPRDLRWCDPSREGPMTAEWSDGEAEPPEFGTFIPKVSEETSSGLEEPVWKRPPN